MSPGAFYGGLDLGGATTQLSFEPPSGVILGGALRVPIGGQKRRVYSHSYARSGQNEAMARYAQRLADADGRDEPFATLFSPCHNPGLDVNYTLTCGEAGACVRTLVGVGNRSACSAHTDGLLNLGNECLLKPCAAQGAYQPPVDGVTLYAVSAYFFLANGLGLVEWDEAKALSTAQIEAAGDVWCRRPYSEVASRFASAWCFSSAYVPSLLGAYGVPRDDRTSVTYARRVEGFAMGWTLGAQIHAVESETYERFADRTIRTPPVPAARSSCIKDDLPYVLGLSVGIPTTALLCLLLGCTLARTRSCTPLSQALSPTSNSVQARSCRAEPSSVEDRRI